MPSGIKRLPTVYLSIENSRAYGRGLLQGIAQYIHRFGPWLFIMAPEFYHSGSRKGRKITTLKKGEIDGIIMREKTKKEMQHISKLDVPIIVASHLTAPSHLPTIMTDCSEISHRAAEHFLARGFRNFAYCGLDNLFWSKRRAIAFGERLKAEGYQTNFFNKSVAAKKSNQKNDRKLLINWLKKLPKPVGILACADDRAEDLVEACMLAEIAIPEEVAILGIDDDKLVCDMAHVPISSISVNSKKAGYQAAELLASLMQGEKMQGQEILVHPGQVKVRRSTDILNIDDVHTRKALNFIQNNFRNQIQVSDVAHHVGLSERGLYERFRQSLGRSVHREITRVRVQEISKLLENSNETIQEIAYYMGFPDDRHLARYFKQQTGILPRSWRNRHQ